MGREDVLAGTMKKTLGFKYGVATEMPMYEYTTIILHTLIHSNYTTFIWNQENT